MGEPSIVSVVSEVEAPCPVCTAAAVRTDAVERRPGLWLWLGECGHCRHRWSAPAPEPALSARGVIRLGVPLAEGVRAA